VSSPLVETSLNLPVLLLPSVYEVRVTRLGIDEHRYRSVRFFRDETGTWRRYEPWMTTLVDLTTGQVLGIVDGRDSAAVGTWLSARSQAWRRASRSSPSTPPPRSARPCTPTCPRPRSRSTSST